ncbi:MAG: rhomboid family intramembrane serine protease [Bdellovibrionota bacterium]
MEATEPQRPTIIIKQNWLTRKPNSFAADFTYIFSFFLFVLSATYLNDYFGLQKWLSATAEQVFTRHEYWRAWSTLFAHGDWGHFLSNALLFIPMTYLFTAHYGYLFFPVVGVFIGGLVNLIVLKTLGPQITLLGISGVVYWMGAAWLTLYALVDRRENLRRRLARVVILTVLLFTPEAYKPQISYLSHLLGFSTGVFSALAFYYLNQKKFLSAEVKEYIYEDASALEPMPPSEIDLTLKA